MRRPQSVIRERSAGLFPQGHICLRMAAALALASFLSGCRMLGVGAGRRVDSCQLAKVYAEGATKKEVERILGRPNSVSTCDDGTRATYSIRLRAQASQVPGRVAADDPSAQAGSVTVSYGADRVVRSVMSANLSKLNLSPARAFQAGKTTRDEVMAAYGCPDCLFRDQNGTCRWLYQYITFDTGRGGAAGGRPGSMSSYEQRISIVFDEGRVVREVTRHEGTKTYQGPVGAAKHAKAFLSAAALKHSKLNRISRDEAFKLFGMPDNTVECTCGERIFSYTRGDVPNDFQCVSITFGSDGRSQNVSSVESSTKVVPDPLNNVRQALFVLGRVAAIAQAASGRAPRVPTVSSKPLPLQSETSESGTRVGQEAAQVFEVGKTTRSEVVEKAGLPETVAWNADGSVEFVYSFTRHNRKDGFLSSANSLDVELCCVRFDPAGKLLKVSTTKSHSKF